MTGVRLQRPTQKLCWLQFGRLAAGLCLSGRDPVPVRCPRGVAGRLRACLPGFSIGGVICVASMSAWNSVRHSLPRQAVWRNFGARARDGSSDAGFPQKPPANGEFWPEALMP